ncbi:hypothetical protein AAF712_011512 [Marasmius tenuissimus]|uniref:Uncharacterized protein n=1 Tax=Marasmius tenuissimus TaxID=585030 RepID=A0ABR2ZKY8_9AGAR
MQFTTVFIAIAACATVAFAASTPEVQRRTPFGSPGSLLNCPPGGTADKCTLEEPCKRIRINYGQQENGHYIWFNYDINNIPNGVQIGVEKSCSDY